MRLLTRAALAIVVCVAIAVPAVALASSGHAARTHTVILKNLRFNPATVTIKRGESVTWVWKDGNIKHNVTGSGFHSRTQSHGSFTVRFTHDGTFKYHCTIHVSMGMVGKVIVRG